MKGMAESGLGIDMLDRRVWCDSVSHTTFGTSGQIMAESYTCQNAPNYTWSSLYL